MNNPPFLKVQSVLKLIQLQETPTLSHQGAVTLLKTNVISRPCPGGERIVDIVLGQGAELELWLRPGCEGLLALTITRCTKCMEFIVSK
jgi:hypothetical protein